MAMAEAELTAFKNSFPDFLGEKLLGEDKKVPHIVQISLSCLNYIYIMRLFVSHAPLNRSKRVSLCVQFLELTLP